VVVLASSSGITGFLSLALNSFSPQTAGNAAQMVIKIAQVPPPMILLADWGKHFTAAPSSLVRNAVLSSTRIVRSALEAQGAFLAGAAQVERLKEHEKELTTLLQLSDAMWTSRAASGSLQQGVGVLHAVGACLLILMRRDNPRWEPAAQNAALACARLVDTSPDILQFVRQHAFPLLQNYRGKPKA